MVKRQPVVARYADKHDAAARNRGLSDILYARVRPCGLDSDVHSPVTGLSHDVRDGVGRGVDGDPSESLCKGKPPGKRLHDVY